MSKLKWRDSEDVYQPINCCLSDFLQEKERLVEADITHLYKSLSTKTMSIFIVKEAENELIKHLSIDPKNETGGVLVGQAYFCQETNSHYTEIVGSIPASYTIGNRVHFKFTPECWQDIFRVQKQDFPNTTIVGWYHSHPGHGIFLSGTDLNTQRLSFKQIWQIATVYDPIRHQIGYFHGADGKRIKSKYLTYLKEKSSKYPKNREPQLPIIPHSEQLQDSNTETSIEQEGRTEEQFVSNEEQQVVPPDVVEEQALSNLDNIYQDFRKFVKGFLNLFNKR